MKEDIFDSRERLEELVRKRKRRKRLLAFILAVTMLVTFAIPVSMMIPVQNSPQVKEKDNGFEIPLYSAEAEA